MLDSLAAMLKSPNPSADQFCELFIQTRVSCLKLSSAQSEFDEYNYDYAVAKQNNGQSINLSELPVYAEVASLQLSSAIAACCIGMSTILHDAIPLFSGHPDFQRILDSYRTDWYKDPSLEAQDLEPALKHLINTTSTAYVDSRQNISPDLIKSATLALLPVADADLPPQIEKIKQLVSNKTPLLSHAIQDVFPEPQDTNAHLVLLHTFQTGDMRTTQIFNLYLSFEHYPILCRAGLTFNAEANCFEYRVHSSFTPSSLDVSTHLTSLFTLLISYTEYIYVNNDKRTYKNQHMAIQRRIKSGKNDSQDMATIISTAQRPT